MAAVVLLGTSVEAFGDDIDTIRDRVVELYAGPATRQPGALYRKHLAAIDRQAREFMRKTTLVANLAQVKPEQLGDQVHRHYRAILVMAQAYASPGSSLFGSDELKARIEAELSRGLRWIKPDTKRPGNWYPWEISTPQVLGPTLLMLKDHIQADLGLLAEYLLWQTLNGYITCPAQTAATAARRRPHRASALRILR